MIELPDFELYLFDLDDTLIGTRSAYRQAQQQALVRAFPDVTNDVRDTYTSMIRWLCREIGSSQPELYFTAFLKNICFPQDELKKTLSCLQTFYSESYWDLLKELPDARSFLNRLRNRGTKIALVSNGDPLTQGEKLRRCSLDRFFDESNRFISGNFDRALQKPSPHMVTEACLVNHVSAENTVFFGNALVDVLAGNLAGVTTVLVGDFKRDDTCPDIALPDHLMERW